MRYVDIPVFHLVMMAGEKVFLPLHVELVEDFLNKVVGRTRSDLHTQRGADGSLGVVGCNHPVVGVDHIADRAAGPQPPAGKRFGLKDLDDIVLEQFGEFIFGMQAFSRRDRYGRSTSDLDQRVDLVVGGGFLEPGGIVGLHLSSEFEGSRRAEPTVPLDQNVHAGSNGIANGGDDVDGERFIIVVRDLIGGPEGIEFQCLVASIDDSLCEFVEVIGRSIATIPSVRIRFNFRSDLSPEKLPAGDPQTLPDDVPARDFDSRYGVLVDLSAVTVDVAIHPLGDPLDLERVHSDEHRLEFVYGGLDCFCEGIDRALPDAGYAFVGVDFREEPVLPGVSGDKSFDLRDLHTSSSACSIERPVR